MASAGPLLVLLAGAILVLVIGMFLPRRRQSWVALLAGVSLALSAAWALRLTGEPPGLLFHGTLAVDTTQLWAVLILGAATVVVMLLSLPLFRRDAREAEFYSLLLFALLGCLLLAGAADLMELLLASLLVSVAGYALTLWRRDDPAALEAVLKFYLFGALTNLGLLLGVVLLFGLTGDTTLAGLNHLDHAHRLAVAAGLVLLLVGLGFKGGWVPAQFWVPDVYQGTNLPVAAMLSVLPKAAAVLAVARVAAAVDPVRVDLAALLAIIAAATMTWGNLAALAQENLRRLLGYSSIAQVGYLLLAAVAIHGSPLAPSALLFAIAAYAVGNLTAFSALAASGARCVSELGGLSGRSPWAAAAFGIGLLSLLGLPPLAGFVGKFLLFTALLDAGYGWLMVLALANTVLSLFYYLRVIAAIFLGPLPEPLAAAEGGAAVVVPGGCHRAEMRALAEERGDASGAGASLAEQPVLSLLPLWVAIGCAIATLALGLGAVLLLEPANHALKSTF